jgi:hypothetical protein
MQPSTQRVSDAMAEEEATHLVGAIGLNVTGLLALVANSITTSLFLWAVLGGMTTLAT